MSFESNAGSLSVNMVSRSRAFQPHLAAWVREAGRYLGATTSETLGLVPRRVVTVAGCASPTTPRRPRRSLERREPILP